MNPRSGFLKQPHSPDEYLAKLAEELGEVAQAHARVSFLTTALLKRARKNPKVLERPLSKADRRSITHLYDELTDVIQVAEAWRAQLAQSPVPSPTPKGK